MKTNNNKLSPEILIREASSIVMKAGKILEDNISEGISMAQEIENKYFKIDELREKEDIVNKFRSDSHNALDMLFDAFSYLVKTANEIVPATKGNIRAERSKNIPVLEPDSEISPGKKVIIPIILENESDSETMCIELTDSGLKSNSDEIIKKNNLTYLPKTLMLNPKEKGKIEVQVYVPKNCKKGTYEGIIQDKIRKDIQALIKIKN